MRFLKSLSESLNIAKINRIAYLTPPQRMLRADKAHESNWENPDDGEIIVDVGRATPVILGYVDDDDVGRVVVALLTNLITSEGPAVIDYEDVVESAERNVAKVRAKMESADSAPDSGGDDELDDIEGFEGVNGWSADPARDVPRFDWRQ